MTSLFLLNLVLAIIWAAVTGSFEAVNILFGFLISSFALWLIREQFSTSIYFVRAYRLLVLLGVFLYELVLSTMRVIRIVWTPGHGFKAGFIAFPLTCDRNIEITLLANLITLTPGTLSVDVSDDRTTLYIHALDVPDVGQFRDEVAKGFERKIMEALR